MVIAADTFSANLAALKATDPELAKRLADVAPAPLQWTAADKDGNTDRGSMWSASIAASPDGTGATGTPAHRLALASRFDPIAEAKQLISPVDLKKHACVVVLGLGLGYHVLELARQLNAKTPGLAGASGESGGEDPGVTGTESVLIVFEPDLGVLRAVLERIDHTSWLGRPNVILADAQMDRAGLLGRLDRYGSIITQGTILITHPPTRQLRGEALAAFGKLVTEALTFCRTNVATALVNASRSVFNLCNNLPFYAAGANTNELHLAAKGFPGVCVGAGPSLARNIDLLRDPGVRGSVVLITAQTTLKPLLDRGIQPDFVTALDYHEISQRFYEGLPDLPGVTLVAQPVAHPFILRSFPGPVRVTPSGFLSKLLGDQAPRIVPVREGATVAHLSFYLAQHLGCDPIILIGQDLGFSDGLYYCPGTAIHDVWAPELNPHNTVEMMEWQRIVRHRNHLQKLDDINGRPIYTDEQMLTYLKQFERDFATAPQKVIDASEGGLPKLHTTRLTLREACARHATRPVPPLPLAARALDPRKLERVAGLLDQRIDEVREIRHLTRKTIPILHQMREHQRDRIRVEKFFARLMRNKKRVEELHEAFELINELNTLGAFRRARADRAIAHGDNDVGERQLHQIDRDLDNLGWLIQACDEALTTFQVARENVERAVKEQGARAAAVS